MVGLATVLGFSKRCSPNGLELMVGADCGAASCVGCVVAATGAPNADPADKKLLLAGAAPISTHQKNDQVHKNLAPKKKLLKPKL